MFTKKQAPNAGLDEAIDDALAQLKTLSVSDPGHTKAMEAVERLIKLRQLEKPERMSRNTLAAVVGNLVGIAMIVGHERAHLVTSKALTFVHNAL